MCQADKARIDALENEVAQLKHGKSGAEDSLVTQAVILIIRIAWYWISLPAQLAWRYFGSPLFSTLHITLRAIVFVRNVVATLVFIALLFKVCAVLPVASLVVSVMTVR